MVQTWHIVDILHASTLPQEGDSQGVFNSMAMMIGCHVSWCVQLCLMNVGVPIDLWLKLGQRQVMLHMQNVLARAKELIQVFVCCVASDMSNTGSY